MRAVWEKNDGRLLGPHLQPSPVDRLLQRHDRGLVEAAAEVASGGRVGQRRRPQAVQEHRVAPAGLDVLQAPAAAQCVVGDVQHVVGLVVGAVDLEQLDRGVDLAGQADRLDQAGDHPHAAMGDPPVPLGPLVADRGSPKQRAGQVGGHRRFQPPLDRQLFALEPALQLSLRACSSHPPS